jgi:hypothetical protein
MLTDINTHRTIWTDWPAPELHERRGRFHCFANLELGGMDDVTDAPDDTAPWSPERIAALGPTTDVPTAASVLGIGSWTVYDLIRRDAWDSTRVLRLGRRIRIPTQDLIRLLYPVPVDSVPVEHASKTV